MEQHEAKLIRDALIANNGDVRSTIETLGIPRKTFYDKLQRHGIDRSGYARRTPGTS
jgi:two-component system C4-dicarboxylate transport response regulator DctD